MTNDKYETFKKWFEENPVLLPKEMKDGNLIFYTQNIFENFEKEQEEKNREKEIEQIIDEEIHELTQGVIGTISMLNMPTKELNARNNIIKRLKEGEYLK